MESSGLRHSAIASSSKQVNSTGCLSVDGKITLKLCDDGFMDFIHRPTSKVLKILKN
jgi:hypothetical protein